MAFPTHTRAGNWTINGIAVGVNPYGAWRIRDLYRLWAEAQKRGGDRRLPTAPGVKAYRRRRDVTQIVLDLQVCGDVNGQTGMPIADTFEGLETNWLYLMGALVDPTAPTSPDGTWPSVLTLPSGATKSQPIHVVSCEPVDGTRNLIEAELVISIPAGTYLA